MKPELKQIYVLKEASDALNQIDTRTPKYLLASQIILSAIKQSRK